MAEMPLEPKQLFLNLQPEIRTQIYKLLFIEPSAVRGLCQEPNPSGVEPRFHNFCQRYNPKAVKAKLNDFEPQNSRLRRGLGLVRACKTIAREATDVLYSSNCFWLYDYDNCKILDWLKEIGRDNRRCLSYLQNDYAYGRIYESPRMKCDSSTDETNRSWTDLDQPSRVGRNAFHARRVPRERSAADTKSDDLKTVVHQSPQKRTLRTVAEIKSVIQYLRHNPRLHRLELMLPDRSWGSLEYKVLDEAGIMRSQRRMHTELFHLRCNFRELLGDLVGIKTLAVGPIIDLDELESIARSIGVTNLMTFGKLKTKPPIDLAQVKGWQISISDRSFKGLKILRY